MVAYGKILPDDAWNKSASITLKLALGSPIFQSKTEMNQWIEWDFKTFQIEPTHYSIRTHGGEAGHGHLRHWVIEGRNEDEKWIRLDER
jgi:hypothetical protein